MDERFIPLAALVRGRLAANAPPPAPLQPSVAPDSCDFAQAGLVHELTLMRLAALEAFQSSAARALQAFASEVLGRELALAPADIDALVARALTSYAEHEPLAIVVSPADVDRVRAPLPLRVDASLAAGDLIVEVRDGSLESHFSFRLDTALRNAVPDA